MKRYFIVAAAALLEVFSGAACTQILDFRPQPADADHDEISVDPVEDEGVEDDGEDEGSGAGTFRAISCGGSHTCAVTTAGGVMCWGLASDGQLGTGAAAGESLFPVEAAGLPSGVSEVSAGWAHTCALLDSGGLKCWGSNAYGKVGNGAVTEDPVLSPADVQGMTSGVTSVSVGQDHTCAVSNGTAFCWGSNAAGQLGTSTVASSNVPVQVEGFSAGDIAYVTAGGDHSCAVTTGGRAYCWGSNVFGELGDGTFTSSAAPVGVYGLSSGGVRSVEAGMDHTCAVLLTGAAWCWGDNAYGQLGHGSSPVPGVPAKVANTATDLEPVRLLAAGGNHTCAVGPSLVKCWGAGGSGQLGIGSTSESITMPLLPVMGLYAGVLSLGAGALHSCGIDSDGVAWCWGDNGSGRLGDGTAAGATVPVRVYVETPP